MSLLTLIILLSHVVITDAVGDDFNKDEVAASLIEKQPGVARLVKEEAKIQAVLRMKKKVKKERERKQKEEEEKQRLADEERAKEEEAQQALAMAELERKRLKEEEERRMREDMARFTHTILMN